MTVFVFSLYLHIEQCMQICSSHFMKDVSEIKVQIRAVKTLKDMEQLLYWAG